MQKSQSSQKKILVIDDDPDIIDFLHDFLAAGAEDFLAKPFELDELLLKIQRYL